MTATLKADLQHRLSRHLAALAACSADMEVYVGRQQERLEQLTRRYQRLERQTDDITDPHTLRNQKLLAQYERLGEEHVRIEEELDDLENVVLEPLREAYAVLHRLVS